MKRFFIVTGNVGPRFFDFTVVTEGGYPNRAWITSTLNEEERGTVNISNIIEISEQDYKDYSQNQYHEIDR